MSSFFTVAFHRFDDKQHVLQFYLRVTSFLSGTYCTNSSYKRTDKLKIEAHCTAYSDIFTSPEYVAVTIVIMLLLLQFHFDCLIILLRSCVQICKVHGNLKVIDMEEHV